MEPAAPANEEAIEAWNTVLFDKFMRFRPLVTSGLGRHGDAVLRLHPPPEGARVLDIGCGFGDTTFQIAKLVGPKGSAVGIDGAPRFVEEGRRQAAAESIDNVRFVVGDVQTARFDQPFDYAFARFGTMFFASAVAALRNVRRALVPGAKLAMVVWRSKSANEWLHRAEQVVAELVPENHDSDLPTCGPGPFSMASADVTSDVLIAAGYRDVAFARSDAEICIGRDLEEALEFAMALGPAGEIIRLAGEEGQRRLPAVREALSAVLGQFERDGQIWAPSSTWVVSATAP
ncbi:MAG: class I SAM-dependent methyltransferase [Deltaproteobacteria bacterium]|nr:class I SAM-dependent methyltransferase [Deltaproteobacteria bacterium]